MNSFVRYFTKYILIAVMFLASCVVHDGPFEQVSGNPIDHAQLKALLQRKAQLDEVIASIGAPQKRVKSSDSQETLTYESVRRRVAYETTLGVRHSESRQDLIESVDLVFEQGRLRDSRTSSTVR